MDWLCLLGLRPCAKGAGRDRPIKRQEVIGAGEPRKALYRGPILAEELGIERHMAHAHLSGDNDLNAVYTENARMHRLGITGVPCYIFNEGRAIAGAQEPEILVRMLDMAVAQDSERPQLQSSG